MCMYYPSRHKKHKRHKINQSQSLIVFVLYVPFCGKKRDEARSRYNVTRSCVCRMEAGCIGLTVCSTEAFTASAFLSSGTMHRISPLLSICLMDIEIA